MGRMKGCLRSKNYLDGNNLLKNKGWDPVSPNPMAVIRFRCALAVQPLRSGSFEQWERPRVAKFEIAKWAQTGAANKLDFSRHIASGNSPSPVVPVAVDESFSHTRFRRLLCRIGIFVAGLGGRLVGAFGRDYGTHVDRAAGCGAANAMGRRSTGAVQSIL